MDTWISVNGYEHAFRKTVSESSLWDGIVENPFKLHGEDKEGYGMMLETPCLRDVAICRYVLKNPNPGPKACAIFALSIQTSHMPYEVKTFSCC